MSILEAHELSPIEIRDAWLNSHLIRYSYDGKWEFTGLEGYGEKGRRNYHSRPRIYGDTILDGGGMSGDFGLKVDDCIPFKIRDNWFSYCFACDEGVNLNLNNGPISANSLYIVGNPSKVFADHRIRMGYILDLHIYTDRDLEVEFKYSHIYRLHLHIPHPITVKVILDRGNVCFEREYSHDTVINLYSPTHRYEHLRQSRLLNYCTRMD